MPSIVKDYLARSQQGDATAQSMMGFCYLFGLGVEKNYALAANLLYTAFQKGKIHCGYDLRYLLWEQPTVCREFNFSTLIKICQEFLKDNKRCSGAEKIIEKIRAYLFLGGVHRAGTINTGVSLFKTLDYYQKAENLSLKFKQSKQCEILNPELLAEDRYLWFLPEIQQRVVSSTSLGRNLAAIVAEYAIDPACSNSSSSSEKPPKGQKRKAPAEEGNSDNMEAEAEISFTQRKKARVTPSNNHSHSGASDSHSSSSSGSSSSNGRLPHNSRMRNN